MFILVTLGILVLGVLNYLMWKDKIVPFEINGGEYLPEFKINYDSFKEDVFNSVGISAVMFLLSLFTAGCKKPFFSFIYITLGFFGCLYVLLASLKCYDFHRISELK